MLPLILKPPLKLAVLLVGERRVEMFDRHVRRRDQHRLSVREGIESVFAVVMASAGWTAAAERHRLDEQVDVHQVHPAAPVGQLADEAIDGLLVAAGDKAGTGPER